MLDDKIPQGLRRLITRNFNTHIGDVPGSLHHTGYYQTKIDNKLYGNHRIIYCMFNNIEMTDIGFIDHIDQNKQNNHPSNLRKATRSQNGRNRRKLKNNTTGYIGVSFHKITEKFVANIRNDNKNKHIGLFTTAESAAHAYDNYLRTNFPSPFNVYNFPQHHLTI